MTKIFIERDANRRIRSYKAEGHAHYADPGEDIVCAGISTVTFGTANALHALVTKDIVTDVSDNGAYFYCRIPDNLSPQLEEKAQTILESLVIMLKQIEISYGKQYIQINDKM